MNTANNNTNLNTANAAQPQTDAVNHNVTPNMSNGQAPSIAVSKFKGMGSAFEPKANSRTSGLNTGSDFNTQTEIEKDMSPDEKSISNKKKVLTAVAITLMVIAGGTLYYTLKILPSKEVPTEPVSVPQADQESPCTVVLTVPSPEAPTATPTLTTTPPAATATPTITLTPPAATATPTLTTTPPAATATPTITLTPPAATATPTLTTAPTATTKPVVTANPSVTATKTPSATVQPSATTKPTTIAVATQPPYTTVLPTEPGQPQSYIVDTSAACNESCTVNSDCANISHICYNGSCRLDVNPEDTQCRTPEGTTTVERVIEQPVAGPAEWLNYLKIGISIIGAGLLLLLFL